MSNTRLVPRARKLAQALPVALALAFLPGCVSSATLMGEPRPVGRDPSGRTVYQAPLWEGGGYFVYDNGARTFMRDR
jgi:hypothetical protein